MQGPQPSRSMTQTVTYLQVYVLRLLARDSNSDGSWDWCGPSVPNPGMLETDLTSISGVPPFDFAQGQLVRALPSFFRSGDVLRLLVHTVTVQGWANTQEKFEGVTEIVAVIPIESVGSVIDSELRAETNV